MTAAQMCRKHSLFPKKPWWCCCINTPVASLNPEDAAHNLQRVKGQANDDISQINWGLGWLWHGDE